MKTSIFFLCLPPIKADDHFSGMLILNDEKLAEELLKDCGGSINRYEYFLN